MAKVFLDTNAFIDLLISRNNRNIEEVDEHDVYISPLSIHITFYTYKRLVPLVKLSKFVKQLIIIDFDKKIASKSLEGPSQDFEDNVQLHSATQAKADYLLTSDRKLLNLKFFGEMQIANKIPIFLN